MNPITLDHSDVVALLPDRDPSAHKGNFGKLLLLCGSRGYTGAACLSAMGALRVGAGLVYLGVPEGIYPIVAGKLLEPVVFPLAEKDGMMAIGSIKDGIEQHCAYADAVLIGPGIGRSKDTEEILKWLLLNYKGTIVIDADGISLLRNHIDLLRGRTDPVILTPHEGEFKRLTGMFCRDRIQDAVTAAGQLGCIMVLKGHDTVITDGKTVYVNPTGNPGMAVGGCGDVLAGMTVGLLGQGLDPLMAAGVAAWVHGAAGDICAERIGMYGMLPSDMLEVIPRLLK